jgi:6,7-dimethyl-8-ribityllumazine synthase
VNVYPSVVDATRLRMAIAVSRFNHLVCVRLLEGCTRELLARGARSEDVDVVWVPGAYEIPHAARLLAESGRYDAVIALGAVIRGGTPHFDFVCRAVTDGIREVVRDTCVPVAFGVLTTDDVEQALARAGGPEGNKGVEAARAAVEMAHLRRALPKPPADAPPPECS